MPLKDLISRERIAVLDAPGNRDAVLDAAARLLADDADGALPIAERLRQRERPGSTAIGYGVAIPHGRSGASDGVPVDLVFAMAVPQHFTQQHLQLLSELAEQFADAGFRDALRQAPDPDALAALLVRGKAA